MSRLGARSAKSKIAVFILAIGLTLAPSCSASTDSSTGSNPGPSVQSGPTRAAGLNNSTRRPELLTTDMSADVAVPWQSAGRPDPGRIVLAQGDVEGWEEVTASRAEELGEEAAIRQSSFERVFRRRASQSRDPDELVVRAKVYDPAVDLQPWGRTQPLGARPVPLPGALADEAIAWWIPGEPASLGIAHLRVANAYIGLRLSTRNADGALPDALVQGWAATLAQRARAALDGEPFDWDHFPEGRICPWQFALSVSDVEPRWRLVRLARSTSSGLDEQASASSQFEGPDNQTLAASVAAYPTVERAVREFSTIPAGRVDVPRLGEQSYGSTFTTTNLPMNVTYHTAKSRKGLVVATVTLQGRASTPPSVDEAVAVARTLEGKLNQITEARR